MGVILQQQIYNLIVRWYFGEHFLVLATLSFSVFLTVSMIYLHTAALDLHVGLGFTEKLCQDPVSVVLFFSI